VSGDTALSVAQIAIGAFGILLGVAAYGAFPPLRRLVHEDARGGKISYTLVAVFGLYMVLSGVLRLTSG
jgi:hypothetical protein